jgi:hypothetical protein
LMKINMNGAPVINQMLLRSIVWSFIGLPCMCQVQSRHCRYNSKKDAVPNLKEAVLKVPLNLDHSFHLWSTTFNWHCLLVTFWWVHVCTKCVRYRYIRIRYTCFIKIFPPSGKRIVIIIHYPAQVYNRVKEKSHKTKLK